MTINPPNLDLTPRVLMADELTKRWNEILDEPKEKYLGFEVEMHGTGRVILSPVGNNHGYIQGRVCHYLIKELGENARVGVEVGVRTTDGFRVPDVWYMTDEQWKNRGTSGSFETAPKLCVEIWSPSNTVEEMERKMELLFEAGAEEVWICDLEGNFAFYRGGEQIAQSQIAPGFPVKINLD